MTNAERTRAGAGYCVIGSQAVSVYVEPLVSLDLDLAVAAEDFPTLEDALRASFRVERAWCPLTAA
jgi:hypothetical protein